MVGVLLPMLNAEAAAPPLYVAPVAVCPGAGVWFVFFFGAHDELTREAESRQLVWHCSSTPRWYGPGSCPEPEYFDLSTARPVVALTLRCWQLPTWATDPPVQQ